MPVTRRCLALGLGLVLAACQRVPDEPEAAFRMLCARCHGEDGRGNPKVRSQKGLDLVASRLIATGDRTAIRQRIERGKGTMPAFGNKLTVAQLEALTAYCAAFAPADPPPATSAQPTGQPDDAGFADTAAPD